jgi:hypothetical protein
MITLLGNLRIQSEIEQIKADVNQIKPILEVPPNMYRVRNIYVNPITGKFVVEYDDNK